MTGPAEAQLKADGVASQFNRVLHKCNDAPITVEKVIMLHIVRDLLATFEKGTGAGTGLDLANIAAVRASLDQIESECRANGLFEVFAELPRSERRRLQKILGDAA